MVEANLAEPIIEGTTDFKSSAKRTKDIRMKNNHEIRDVKLKLLFTFLKCQSRNHFQDDKETTGLGKLSADEKKSRLYKLVQIIPTVSLSSITIAIYYMAVYSIIKIL